MAVIEKLSIEEVEKNGDVDEGFFGEGISMPML
jgi:hypothetical protein